MKLCVLVGGVGGAKFLQGARTLLGADAPESPHSIDAVVNIGDDAWMHGLRICPDLDTCMYTLGGGIDTERGWGHRGETWNAKEELAAYGVQPDWFGLGDRDIATHLVRTQMLGAGYGLTDVTAALCTRWTPGVTLLPVSDDRSETHVIVSDPEDPTAKRAIHFQEWWVRYRADIPTESFTFIGAEQATPTKAVLDAIAGADAIILAPSNPIVSIGAILAIPGVRSALRQADAPVVGISPIIGGAPLRGMADRCLEVSGIETSATAVAQWYGARSGSGLLDAWLVAPGDRSPVDGVDVREAPLLMTTPEHTSAMVAAALESVGVAP